VILDTDGRRHRLIDKSLAKRFGVEASDVVILYGKADLNRLAAYLAVFDIGLATDGQVQDHRNLFAAIRAAEFVLH
jgi:hypothetical protein